MGIEAIRKLSDNLMEQLKSMKFGEKIAKHMKYKPEKLAKMNKAV